MYCQTEIEGGEPCKVQCDHCKEYYKPLEEEKKHEYVKFNPTGVEKTNVELFSNNLTKEILEDGRESYSIFFENKIINIIRIPENFKTMKNDKPFIRMSVVNKNDKKYISSQIDNIAIID